MLPQNWITDRCPEVLDYLNKKHKVHLKGVFKFYGERGNFIYSQDIIRSSYTYLTTKEFLEMTQKKEVWKEGDILFSKQYNSYRKIFLVIDNIVFVSEGNIDKNLIRNTDSLDVVTKEYLESKFYKLYKPEEVKVVELTLKEIAEKFNVDVKSLKIKM